MLKDRVKSALIVVLSLCCLLFLDLIFNTSALSGFILIVALLFGLWEFSEMAHKQGIDIHFKTTALFTFLWIFNRHANYDSNVCPYIDGVIIFGFFVSIAILQVRRLGIGRDDECAVIATLGASLLGFAYLALAGGYLYQIRLFGIDKADNQIYGIRYLMYFILIVKSTDIGAYFTGRQFGATKLIAKLSPGKTVEGLIGGVSFAMFLAVIFNWFLGIGELSFFGALFFGLVMGLLGQSADLFESLLKRSSDVKDSGSIIPGMGGVLDVLDSLILTAPVAYWMFLIFA